MDNYYSIMVEFSKDKVIGRVYYTCEELTLDSLQSYMCDLIRLYPNETIKKVESGDIFYFYDNPDEEDIVQFVFKEDIDDGKLHIEHYIVYGKDGNAALHNLKDYFISDYFNSCKE